MQHLFQAWRNFRHTFRVRGLVQRDCTCQESHCEQAASFYAHEPGLTFLFFLFHLPCSIKGSLDYRQTGERGIHRGGRLLYKCKLDHLRFEFGAIQPSLVKPAVIDFIRRLFAC